MYPMINNAMACGVFGVICVRLSFHRRKSANGYAGQEEHRQVYNDQLYYPRHIWGVGFCRALCRLSVCPTVRPCRPRYHFTGRNIQPILFIFGTTIDISRILIPLIRGLLCSLCRIQWHAYTGWLAFWTRRAEGSHPVDGIFNLRTHNVMFLHIWKLLMKTCCYIYIYIYIYILSEILHNYGITN